MSDEFFIFVMPLNAVRKAEYHRLVLGRSAMWVSARDEPERSKCRYCTLGAFDTFWHTCNECPAFADGAAKFRDHCGVHAERPLGLKHAVKHPQQFFEAIQKRFDEGDHFLRNGMRRWPDARRKSLEAKELLERKKQERRDAKLADEGFTQKQLDEILLGKLLIPEARAQVQERRRAEKETAAAAEAERAARDAHASPPEPAPDEAAASGSRA